MWFSRALPLFKAKIRAMVDRLMPRMIGRVAVAAGPDVDEDFVPDVVVEFQSPSAALLAMPVSGVAHNMTWIITSMFAACVFLMGIIPIDRVVVARAKVISVMPTITIQPLETSVVRSIEVREGQRVKTGDLLARLDPTFTAADESAVSKQVSGLQAEVARLRAEVNDEDFASANTEPAWSMQAALFTQRKAERLSKLETYTQKLTSLKALATRSEQDAESARQRLGVAKQVENMRKELEAKGSGSKLNTLLATNSRIEIEALLSQALNSAEAARRDLAAMESERDAYDKNWHAEALQNLTQKSNALNDAKETLNKAGRRQELTELRAQSDATVLTVAKLSIGSVVQSGDQLITMAPAGTPLEIEANISGQDGFVREGDPVAVKFDMLPFTRHGLGYGTVKTISADSFTAQDEARSRVGWSGSIPTNNAAELYFRSRITIDRLELHDLPSQFRLSPGMPATAEIKIGKRTVLSYLLGHVVRVGSEGMREP
jgi:HlyD family secretion protein